MRREKAELSSGATRRSPVGPRLIAVLVGYAAGCIMAGLVLLVATALPQGLLMPEVEIAGSVVASSLFVIGLFSAFVAALAFGPALIGILVAEILVIRSLFYYVLGGGLVGGLGYYFSAAQGIIPLTDLDQRTSETIILTVAGLVAGFSYWAVSGRNAGMARHFRD